MFILLLMKYIFEKKIIEGSTQKPETVLAYIPGVSGPNLEK